MTTGELYASKDGAVAYQLQAFIKLHGQDGWSCGVYKNLANRFYVCMRGITIAEDGSFTELYTGQGFISNEAIERFCELRNDIMLMEPIAIQSAPSRN